MDSSRSEAESFGAMNRTPQQRFQQADVIPLFDRLRPIVRQPHMLRLAVVAFCALFWVVVLWLIFR